MTYGRNSDDFSGTVTFSGDDKQREKYIMQLEMLLMSSDDKLIREQFVKYYRESYGYNLFEKDKK